MIFSYITFITKFHCTFKKLTLLIQRYLINYELNEHNVSYDDTIFSHLSFIGATNIGAFNIKY